MTFCGLIMQYLRRAVTVLGVFILIAGHFKAFCDEGYNVRRKLSDDVDISVSLDTILKNGSIDELVFPSEETDNPYYSKLDWSAANVFFIGLSAEVTVLKQLSFRAAVHTNVNDGFGFMEDYDWEEYDSPQWTHYSKSHSNAVPFNTWLCDFNILYQFPKFSYFKIYSGLGVQYQRWSFEDELISVDYPDTGTDIDQYKGINSISYRVNYFFPEILIGGDFEYKKFKTVTSRKVWFSGVYRCV